VADSTRARSGIPMEVVAIGVGEMDSGLERVRVEATGSTSPGRDRDARRGVAAPADVLGDVEIVVEHQARVVAADLNGDARVDDQVIEHDRLASTEEVDPDRVGADDGGLADRRVLDVAE
jgi:hypothetical protein